MSNITSVRLGKNSRKSIREALYSNTLTTAIIPLGSTEQHNEHLAMEQDAAGVEHIAVQVAKKLFPHVIVTPVISVGSSPHHMHHPGTLTLQTQTLVLLLRDIVDSLAKHGFKYIMILNGHGGNVRALDKHLDEIKPSENVKFLFCSFWDVANHDFIKNTIGESAIFPGHAGIFETSFALAAFPQNVDRSATYPEKLLKSDDPAVARDHLLFNESRQATAKIGEAILQHIVENLQNKIKQWIDLK